jgi:photosystem II stability/assembly factor-like uncharacterized protein
VDAKSATNHELITKPVFFIILLLASTQAALRAQSPTQTWVEGRCTGCRFPFQLGRIQFVTPTEGWATGFIVQVTEAHASQMSTILHTTDGGRTWKPVKHWETYGLEVEPAFWFIDARHGWSAWPVAWSGSIEMLRTGDGGRRWHKIGVKDVNSEGPFTHLRFFDQHRGYGVTSTMDGGRFAVTSDGGTTWSSRPIEAGYPSAMVFLNPDLGWMGSSAGDANVERPRVLRTADGGQTWSNGTFPNDTHGVPFDLFFLDAQHGWMVLGNGGQDASASLLQTTDGGRTWTRLPDTGFAGPNTYINSVRFLSDQIGFVFIDAVTETPAGERLTSDAAVFSTRDRGLSWTRDALKAAVSSCQVVGGEVWCSSGMNILKLRP